MLSTGGKEGLPRWIKPSMAERIARKSETMTLFVPANGSGFVSREDGKFSLRRILVPVDRKPGPLPAIEYATRAAERFMGEDTVEIILYHVGDLTTMPAFDIPKTSTCIWRKVYQQGDVVEKITGAVEEYSIDLIIMTTAGREGVLDVLRGSVTEQVLRQASCPLLAVPAVRG